MPDVGLWLKNANIQARCPSLCGTTAKAMAATDIYVLDIENYVNILCKANITAAVYTALSANVKYVLMDLGACLGAMYVINADTSGFTSLREAELAMDFLRDRIERLTKILEDTDKTVFMGVIT